MATFPNDARASFYGILTIEKIFTVLNAFLQARKLIAGGYDPLKTEVVEGQGYTIISANQAGEIFGFGSQLHRMAIYQFKGAGGGIPLTMFPLAAAAGGAAATKTVTFATDATSAGTYYLRVGSYLIEDLIQIGVSSGDTPDDIAALLVSAVSDNPNLPFTASAALGVVTLTAKTADINSEDLRVTANLTEEEAESLPGGMTIAIVDGVTGAGSSDLADLWAYVQAESTAWFTSIVHPYTATTALDAGSVAIGNPNDQTGNYDVRDYRPASVYTCDTTPDEAGLVAALALGNARDNDCANVRLEAPDYPELGYEISTYVSAVMEQSSMSQSSRGYTHLSLPELYGPVDPLLDWTTYKSGGKSYDNRDLAVKAGLTPIVYKDGVAKPGDITGFWKPSDNQNAPFKFQVNRWKAWSIQNLYNIYVNGDDNKGRAIVINAGATNQSEGAIDDDILKAGLAQVTSNLGRNAWIYDSEFTIRNTLVEISTENPDRFNFTIPVVLSGNNRINVGTVQIDRDPSVVTLTIVQQ